MHWASMDRPDREALEGYVGRALLSHPHNWGRSTEWIFCNPRGKRGETDGFVYRPIIRSC